MDYDAVDREGSTAMHWACAHGRQGVIEVLLRAGGRQMRNHAGLTPLPFVTMQLRAFQNVAEIQVKWCFGFRPWAAVAAATALELCLQRRGQAESTDFSSDLPAVSIHLSISIRVRVQLIRHLKTCAADIYHTQ